MRLLRTIALCLLLGLAHGVPQAAADDMTELQQMDQFIDIMQGYFAIIEATYAVAADRDKAAILQMQKIKELMDETGQRSRAVEIFRDVLKRTSRPAVRNAAALLLSETLKEAGDTREAADVLLNALNANLEATD